ncbi:hypothetical protein UFOVP36_16 [uncultured Caudovirales phage]|uniref:Uncharacterized protein n=1 Tax=uncultured Caudovirales phage TaxID=2100421 RepID=A0A6J5KM97_9CAUD|nr:hypothetical protein UFOVP36_16 [uncultured Caudovirales phage]
MTLKDQLDAATDRFDRAMVDRSRAIRALARADQIWGEALTEIWRLHSLLGKGYEGKNEG